MLRNPSKRCTSGPALLNSAHMFGRPSSPHPPQRQCTCQEWCGVCEFVSVGVWECGSVGWVRRERWKRWERRERRERRDG